MFVVVDMVVAYLYNMIMILVIYTKLVINQMSIYFQARSPPIPSQSQPPENFRRFHDCDAQLQPNEKMQTRNGRGRTAHWAWRSQP